MEFIEKYVRVEGSDDEMKDNAGGDEVNELDSEFIDDETNFQDQEPTNYRLMNVTSDLREAITNQSMAQELHLVSKDPEILKILFLILLTRSFMNLMNFLALKKGFKNSTRNLKFLIENQKIPLFFHTLCNLLSFH